MVSIDKLDNRQAPYSPNHPQYADNAQQGVAPTKKDDAFVNASVEHTASHTTGIRSLTESIPPASASRFRDQNAVDVESLKVVDQESNVGTIYSDYYSDLINNSEEVRQSPETVDSVNCDDSNQTSQRLSTSPKASSWNQFPVELWGEVSRSIPLPPAPERHASAADKMVSLGEHKLMGLAIPGFWETTVGYNTQISDRIATRLARDFIVNEDDSMSESCAAYVRRVKSLSLPREKIGKSPKRLDKLNQILVLTHQLQELNLSQNNIDADGARGLALTSLIDLQTLDLSENPMRSAGAQGLALANLTKLRHLNLSTSGIGSAGASGLELSTLTNLESLNLSHNPIADAGARGLPLATLRNLKRLDLASVSIGDAGVPGLALTNLVNLETLNLSFNTIFAFGAQGLPLATLSNLQHLNLKHNAIGDSGVRGLALSTLTNLRILNLNSNVIGDSGAQGLALTNLTKLETLDLGRNMIGDSGIQHLALGKFSNLQKLIVSHNLIGDVGVRGSAWATLPNLRFLDLSNNNIHDNDAIGLAEVDVVH